jgi:hypothetical protein
MQRPVPWLWIALVGLLLFLPGPSGRFLLDLLGGLTLTLILLPLLAAGAGLLAWQLLLRPRLRRCSACGMTSLGGSNCPACGASIDDPAQADLETSFFVGPTSSSPSDDVTNVTINVQAVDVDADSNQKG